MALKDVNNSGFNLDDMRRLDELDTKISTVVSSPEIDEIQSDLTLRLANVLDEQDRKDLVSLKEKYMQHHLDEKVEKPKGFLKFLPRSLRVDLTHKKYRDQVEKGFWDYMLVQKHEKTYADAQQEVKPSKEKIGDAWEKYHKVLNHLIVDWNKHTELTGSAIEKLDPNAKWHPGTNYTYMKRELEEDSRTSTKIVTVFPGYHHTHDYGSNLSSDLGWFYHLPNPTPKDNCLIRIVRPAIEISGVISKGTLILEPLPSTPVNEK